MADSSVEARGPGAPAGASADGPDPASLAWAARRVPAGVVVKADLLPAVSVLSTVALLGIPLGWLWSRLAPPQRVRILAEPPPVPLQLESWHRFDDLVIFLLLGLAAGVLTGVAVWLLRERRGPVILIAAVAGSLIASWLGARMGLTFADSLYAVAAQPQLGDVVEQAPRLESGWTLLAQPLAAALVYGVLAAWNGNDDLGRRLG
ncbi:hypothetical protein CFN78_25420 [Amycolatopsis antarctica]|uniref:DUF2567 domain-containing protein n=1 Tax=Amycolatopsis antarctica TaxID=1854586 RepID=A0A263CWN6_9PSEU|nr:DUF2567 domain-containing protein [Amycolatopsis antarctica]OZM70501.1 hypothetical protein CFN78_25420 [Amycolatopsis antarctica]